MCHISVVLTPSWRTLYNAAGCRHAGRLSAHTSLPQVRDLWLPQLLKLPPVCAAPSLSGYQPSVSLRAMPMVAHLCRRLSSLQGIATQVGKPAWQCPLTDVVCNLCPLSPFKNPSAHQLINSLSASGKT